MKWYRKPSAILIVLLVLFPALGMSGCNTSAAATLPTTSTTTKAVATTTIATIATEAALQTFTSKDTAAPTVATVIAEPIDMQAVAGGVLRVHFLDVGQADSEFIELPDGKTMLIDAGNKGDGSTVVSYINNLGYSTIDYLVATHPHEDHIGGMAEVINNFSIGQIYMPKAVSTTQTFEDLLTTIQNKGYTINTAAACVQNALPIAPGINILSPSILSNYGTELNNWSAVVSITFGSKTFLFLGDAGTSPESSFEIDADVIKVAHHGSRTAYSADLYSKWSPEIAIISVGAGNSYGLPDEEVISGLEAAGATVYRTDENGTIVIESDGSTITAKSIERTTTVVPASTAAAVTTPKETTATTVTETEPPATEAAPVVDTGTVYITNTGSKYHNDGCRYLSESQIAISKADAIAQGYDACKVCDP